MNHFDQVAKTWDNNPIVWERSSAIANMMMQKLTFTPEKVALEFGAGTGALSFLLKDQFAEITLMDSSVEMVKVMEDKIQKSNVPNLKPVFFDLLSNDFKGSFDIIYSQMALHHVEDTKLIIEKFYKMLNPSGQIAIADLYKEDGSFHDWKFNGHLGFDVAELSGIFKEVGFQSISHDECYVIKKPTGNNIVKEYPIFLITAIK